jgi:hypothetical protein
MPGAARDLPDRAAIAALSGSACPGQGRAAMSRRRGLIAGLTAFRRIRLLQNLPANISDTGQGPSRRV